MTIEINFAEILKEAKRVVEDSSTKSQFRDRSEKLGRLGDILASDLSSTDKMAAIMSDFDLFCIVFIRLDDMRPMFPAIWQSEVVKIVEKHEENLFIEARKVGKSAILSAYCMWKMVTTPGTRIVIFAPTQDQLFVMEDVYKGFMRNSWLMDNFVRPNKGGTFGREYIRLGANESEAISSNLAQQQDADTKRGQKGSIILVDEIQSVFKGIKSVVIEPMLADAYTKKKIIMVGTPKKTINPDLENDWNVAQKSEYIGTHHVNRWDSVIQGVTTPSYVRLRFRSLHINCPWGLYHGICGKRWYPDESYSDPGGPYDRWECDEVCMQNEDFVAEDMGEFPSIAGKFFPKPYMHACGDPRAVWLTHAMPGEQYVIGVDYGLLMNPTQIVVLRVTGNLLTLVNWREIPPVSTDEQSRSGSRSYDPVVKAVKETYARFSGGRNQVRWLFVDATQPGLQVTHDLTKGERPIPAGRIWSNKSSENKGVKGVWFSGPYKDQMMQNYRKIIMDGRLIVPLMEPFWTKFLTEHDNVQVEPVGGVQNYLKFQPPRGGSIDIIVALSLAALILSPEVGNASMYLGYVLMDARVPRRTKRLPEPELTREFTEDVLF